jgi:hypothetical protein
MLCKDSWIDISWDGSPVRTQKENLKVKFNRRAKNLINFDLACDQAAKEIYDCSKNLYVAFSGGSDSEYVASCFLRNNIPFTPLLVDYKKYQTTIPQYELWYAHQWCKKHQIQPKIFEVDTYPSSAEEKQHYDKIKPRLFHGVITSGSLSMLMDELGGSLVTGAQLEYYPDHEQMTYLEPQLKNYNGFVMEESDYYLEMLNSNRHPWAFFYWSPEVMSSFVNEWDPHLTMQENKSAIYKTSPRPKFGYTAEFFTEFQYAARKALIKKWGTVDCALLGNKEQLLAQLLE